MSKQHYEVTIQAFTTVLVIAAADRDEACERAQEESSMFGWEIDRMECKEIPDGELEASRRHANNVSEE